MARTDAMRAYLERTTGRSMDGLRPRFLTGWQVVEALWPLLEWLQPRNEQLKSLPYEPAFEAEADLALEALEISFTAAWASSPSSVVRVLSERVQQGITAAAANDADGSNPQFMPTPPGLTAQQTTVAAALFLLHQMKLLLPPGHQSGFSHPPGSAAAPLRQQ